MKRLIAEFTLMVIGAFFIVDALLLKLITFDYSSIGIGWLDPYFSHLYLGLIIVIIAVYDIRISRG